MPVELVCNEIQLSKKGKHMLQDSKFRLTILLVGNHTVIVNQRHSYRSIQRPGHHIIGMSKSDLPARGVEGEHDKQGDS